MPNPLSRVRLLAGVVLSPDVVLEAPDLFAYAMHVISVLAYCDAALTALTTKFLKADFRVVNEMLEALSSSKGRRDAITAAAHASLSSDDINLFDQVCRAIAPSRSTRNDFAHKLWAISPHVPDALLLVETRGYTSMEIQGAEMMANLLAAKPEEVIPNPDIDIRSLIAVYKRAELAKESRAAGTARGLVIRLRDAFDTTSPARDQARLSLSIDLQARQKHHDQPRD